MRYKGLQRSDDFATGCFAAVLVILLSMAIGALTWPYTINTWLDYFGKPPAVQWWHGSLLAFAPLLGKVSIAAAVLTWIAMFFLR